MLVQMKAGPWELTVMRRRRGPTERVPPARILAVLLRAETKVLPEMYALPCTFADASVVLPAVSVLFGPVCRKQLSLITLNETSACGDPTIE